MGLYLLRLICLLNFLLGICLCQTYNLRPLNGYLNDFDGRRVANSLDEPDLNEFDFDNALSSLEEALLETSFDEGIIESQHQEQIINNSPSQNPNVAARFLAALRLADEEAVAASCFGRALIEITRKFAEKHDTPLCDEHTFRKLKKVNPKLDDGACHRRLKTEKCEDLAPPSPCSKNEVYRRLDGSCNNMENPTWGRYNHPFARYYYPDYENCLCDMRGHNRTGADSLPSARTVSYNLHNIEKVLPPLRDITLMLAQFGQFLDHDITFTVETRLKRPKGEESSNSYDSSHQIKCCEDGETKEDDLKIEDCRPINTTGDPEFKPKTCMQFIRSMIASKGCALGPREQVNQDTSYIDASVVYGSTEKVSKVLREFTGGRLRTFQNGTLPPRSLCPDEKDQCVLGGDRRSNENPGLASMHTLFLRTHNKLVEDFAKENPHWNDETLYQEARRVIGALIQQMVYRDFLPLVLGSREIKKHKLQLADLTRNPSGTEYDENEDASIRNVVATAAYRFGHSLVGDIIKGTGGKEIDLHGNLLTSKVLFEENSCPSALLQGLASESSQRPDFNLVDTLTNRLFAPANNRTGSDLMALNIQRGRDHGIPPYNTWREACGLKRFSTFGELSSVMPIEVLEVFRKYYSNVNEIDLFPAGISEHCVDGGLVGPTFACLLGPQFSSLKKGDRFFFQNMKQPKPFKLDQLKSMEKINLASLICQHMDVKQIQPNVFKKSSYYGNPMKSCSSYPILDTSLWKETKYNYRWNGETQQEQVRIPVKQG